jgi:hypothetical protein
MYSQELVQDSSENLKHIVLKDFNFTEKHISVDKKSCHHFFYYSNCDCSLPEKKKLKWWEKVGLFFKDLWIGLNHKS